MVRLTQNSHCGALSFLVFSPDHAPICKISDNFVARLTHGYWMGSSTLETDLKSAVGHRRPPFACTVNYRGAWTELYHILFMGSVRRQTDNKRQAGWETLVCD